MGEVPGYVGWREKVWLKYGEVERCWWLVERAPFAKGRPLCKKGAPLWGRSALVAYLIGRGSSPSRSFGDFLLFFHAAKS